jgi:hypothetical protein
MSPRYLTNITFVLLGGFVIVASMAFAVPEFTWLMFGAGIAALALAAPGIAIVSRGSVQRGLDGLIGVIGGWTIVASMVFGGLAITWLGFASGAAFVALALIGLTVHELSAERVVHSFEVRTTAPEREIAGVR